MQYERTKFPGRPWNLTRVFPFPYIKWRKPIHRSTLLHSLIFESLKFTLCIIRFNIQKFLSLVDLQLDAQNSCLFTYNIFIKILYMFRAVRCKYSVGLSRNCIYAASGIVTLCRWLSCAPINTLRTGSFKLFKRPFPGFLKILTL